MKEQTNQDIDKLFGIKFDNKDSARGINGQNLNLSPQINNKGSNLDSLKKTDFLNSSIGSISLKKLENSAGSTGANQSNLNSGVAPAAAAFR